MGKNKLYIIAALLGICINLHGQDGMDRDGVNGRRYSRLHREQGNPQMRQRFYERALGVYQEPIEPTSMLEVNTTLPHTPFFHPNVNSRGEVFRTVAPAGVTAIWRFFHAGFEKGRLFSLDNDNTFTFESPQGDMSFNTGGTNERARIVGNNRLFIGLPVQGGNIGIGCTDPLSLLHLGDNVTGRGGYRNWMSTANQGFGTFMHEDTDNMFVGLIRNGNNRHDAVINWGDDPSDDARGRGDFLRFIFTAWSGFGLPASGNNGVEVARMSSDGIFGRMGIGGDPFTNLYRGGSAIPTNTLEINSFAAGPATLNNATPTSTGFSGLRFTDLDATSVPQPNPTSNVLSVDGNGDVILVQGGGNGIHCWDLNGNGIGDVTTEDINGDGGVDVVDCRGATGPAGPTGPAGLNGSNVVTADNGLSYTFNPSTQTTNVQLGGTFIQKTQIDQGSHDFYIYGAGNMAIGSAQIPKRRLSVTGELGINNIDGGERFYFTADNSTPLQAGALVFSGNGSQFNFKNSAGVNKMTFDERGLLNINANDFNTRWVNFPSADGNVLHLDVNGRARIFYEGTDMPTYLQIDGSPGQGLTPIFRIDADGNSGSGDAVEVGATGNLIVGGTAYPINNTYKLEVNGATRISNGLNLGNITSTPNNLRGEVLSLDLAGNVILVPDNIGSARTANNEQVSQEVEAAKAEIQTLKAQMAELQACLASLTNCDGIRSEAKLNQNNPNPFSDKTMISYSLAEKSNVELNVYSMQGVLITTLVRGEQQAGSYSVDCCPNSSLSAGSYIYVLTANGKQLQKKAVVIK